MYLGSLPAVSNKATYRQSFQVNDSADDSLVDLSDALITFEIRDAKTRQSKLTATVGSGIAVVGLGVFEVEFASSSMRQLCQQDYEVGCTIQQDTGEDVEQFIIGTLPVLDGIVT